MQLSKSSLSSVVSSQLTFKAHVKGSNCSKAALSFLCSVGLLALLAIPFAQSAAAEDGADAVAVPLPPLACPKGFTKIDPPANVKGGNSIFAVGEGKHKSEIAALQLATDSCNEDISKQVDDFHKTCAIRAKKAGVNVNILTQIPAQVSEELTNCIRKAVAGGLTAYTCTKQAELNVLCCIAKLPEKKKEPIACNGFDNCNRSAIDS